MTVIESLIQDLRNLPRPKLVDVSRYVHNLSEPARRERLALLLQTDGVWNEQDGQAFGLALDGARRVKA